MGLLDFITKRNLTTTVRFKFVELRACVIQEWFVPATPDRVVAAALCYLAKYFCICDPRHREPMLEYISEIFDGRFRFQKDATENVYSHQEAWSRITAALSDRERSAISHFFNMATGFPVYYTRGDVADGTAFTQYTFDVKLAVNHPPIYYLKLGKFDKLLLPLSVSVFSHHSLLQSGSSAAKLSALSLDLVDRVRFSGISIFSSKRLLSDLFKHGQLNVA